MSTEKSGLTTITERELITQMFGHLNSFKRHRALKHMNRIKGERELASFHELKEYQMIDALELSLRAVQKGVRVLTEQDEEEDSK